MQQSNNITVKSEVADTLDLNFNYVRYVGSSTDMEEAINNHWNKLKELVDGKGQQGSMSQAYVLMLYQQFHRNL